MSTISTAFTATLASILIAAYMDASANTVAPHAPYVLSPEAQALHRSLVIGDLHADSTLWGRNLGVRNSRGHLDLPRLREGNVALQMFTAVTKSPSGQNYEENSADSFDDITAMAIVQRWPRETWTNLTERALFQAGRLRDLSAKRPGELRIVLDRQDLQRVLRARAAGGELLGALLGVEGAHALEGDLANVAKLYRAGFRMIGLHHFFDNALGGSLHGVEGGGLTEFGRRAVEEMQRVGVMVDVSHSSPEVVEDVLEISGAPLIVSHSGFHGHCPSQRNVSDEVMVRIAEAGGIVAVGFWDGAVCGASPANIVAAIRYGVDLLGVDHVALGSDFDGSTDMQLDVSELAALTHEMLKAGFTEREIRRVMGGNMVRFLTDNLPSAPH